MATRILSRTLLLGSSSFLRRHRSSFLRHYSSKEMSRLFEIDLDSSDSSSPASAINRMEEIIHGIIVQKSTPDWLPFLPGSSFWVPQPCQSSKRVSDFADQLANQLTPDVYLSVTTGRGWPCISFFVLDDAECASVDLNLNLKFPEQKEEDEELKVVISIDSSNKSS